VVNKDKAQLTEPIYDIPKEADEPDMTLIEMTERALSSFNNLPIFTVRKKDFFFYIETEIFLFRMTKKIMVKKYICKRND